MSKPFEKYINLKVETFIDPVLKRKRVRPLGGQGYDTSIAVECCRTIRKNYPIGTKFIVRAKLTDRSSGGEYFYSHHSWQYQVLENE